LLLILAYNVKKGPKYLVRQTIEAPDMNDDYTDSSSYRSNE
jgi:hypothetical protein